MVAQSKGQLQSSSATKIGESVLIQKSQRPVLILFLQRWNLPKPGGIFVSGHCFEICVCQSFCPCFFFSFGQSWSLLNLHWGVKLPPIHRVPWNKFKPWRWSKSFCGASSFAIFGTALFKGIPILFWETQMSCQFLLFSFGSLHCCQFHTFGRWQGRATQTWKVRAHHVGSTTTLAWRHRTSLKWGILSIPQYPKNWNFHRKPTAKVGKAWQPPVNNGASTYRHLNLRKPPQENPYRTIPNFPGTHSRHLQRPPQPALQLFLPTWTPELFEPPRRTGPPEITGTIPEPAANAANFYPGWDPFANAFGFLGKNMINIGSTIKLWGRRFSDKTSWMRLMRHWQSLTPWKEPWSWALDVRCGKAGELIAAAMAYSCYDLLRMQIGTSIPLERYSKYLFEWNCPHYSFAPLPEYSRSA